MANDLTYTVVGKDHASKAFREAGKSAGLMGRDVKESSKAMTMAGAAAKKSAALAKGLAISAAAVTVAAGGLAYKLGKDSVKAASSLNETMNKSQAVFGKSAGSMQAWSKTASKSFGMSQNAALAGASQFGNFFDQIGIGSQKSAEMSKQLVKMSADLGSFSDADPAEVMNAFQAATRGEYDSLQKFIPTVNAATVETEALRMSHKSSAKDLTASEKALALYSMANRDAGKAMNDFGKTANSMANVQRSVKGGFEDVKSTIGQALLPAMVTLGIGVRDKVLPAFKDLAVKHGPAITATLTRLARFVTDKAVPAGIKLFETYGPKIGNALGKIPAMARELFASFKGDGTGDSGKKFKEIVESLKKLGPLVVEFKNSLPSMNDALSVGSTVIGFFAKHVDTLKKWMPALVAAFVAFKIAQAAANIATLVALPLRIAETVATRAHTNALKAQAATQRAATGTSVAANAVTTATVARTNAGTMALVRARVAIIAQAVASKAAAAAAVVWTGVTWALNAAMAANPIGVIVLVVVALVAALVLAYKKSDTFRRIVDTAWRGIAKAAKWAWETVLKPVLIAYGKYVVFMWNKAKPVFAFLKNGFQAWMTFGRFMWVTVLRPVLSAIGAYISFMWRNVVSPVFGFLKVGFQVWMKFAQVMWNTVLKPVFSAIGTVVRFLWENALKPAFGKIKDGWAIALRAIQIVWNSVLKPVFNAVGTAVGKLKGAFDTAVKGIGVIWGRLTDLVKKPIRVIIETVLNNGLIRGWNWINENALGNKFPIKPIPLKGLNKGGILPGYTPGVDNQIVAASGGEAFMVPEWTRAVGPARINFWNRLARRSGPGAIQREMQLSGMEASQDIRIPGFADGGIFGKVKEFGSKAWDVAKTKASDAKDVAAKVLDFLKDPSRYLRKMMDKVMGGLNQFKGSQLGKMLTQVPAELINKFINEAKAMVFGQQPGGSGGADGGEWLGGPVSERVKRTQDFIRQQGGKPYIWASAGPRGYDCSGFVSAVWNLLSGKNPYSHTFSTRDMPGSYFKPGKGVFTVGYSKPGQRGASASIGHTAGNLAGLPFESGGALGNTHFGKGSTPVGSFANIGHKPGVFDKGGWLLPGMNHVEVRRNRAELVPDPRGQDAEVVHLHQTIQLDSMTFYKGLIKIKRRLGGTWELA